jgi:AraC-like DNA-binding protein
MEVHNYRKNLRNEFSNIEKNENIAWVLFISIFYILYCFLLLAIGSIVLFSKIDIPVSQTFNLSSLLVLLYIISYYGIRRKELKILFNPKENNCHASYKNSNLSKEQKSLIRTKLDDILNKDKLYLNPQLSMDILSSALNIPKYQITEVLSTEIGKNFFQYINSYRVNAVTKMLADKSNHYSIDAIGYECGFSSKSSFYTFFRSSTGLTPYEYKLRLQKIEKKK